MDTRCGEKFRCDIVVDVTQRVGHTRRECNAEATSETGQQQADGHRSPRKIDVTGKLTVVSVSVVTLIRTDTTLDHSQKAEKV